MDSNDGAEEILELLEYANEQQKEVLKAYAIAGSYRKAAEALGLNSHATVIHHVKNVRKAAAMQGVSPTHGMKHGVPEPFHVKGVSTLYDSDGKVSAQWVKSAVAPEKMKAIAEAAANSFFLDRKSLPPIPDPWDDPNYWADDSLCTIYPIADLHLGMYAWAKECGADYDCDIASRSVLSGFSKLIERGPDTEECIIAQLGDLLHMDDDSNATKRSGNVLDVDTRYHRVAEVGLRIYRQIIDAALKKHSRVHVVNVPGNHDDITAFWLGIAVQTAYENEPRISIDNSPGPFFYHRFGRNLFGFCHGHTAKPEALGEIMVSDVPELISKTDFRVWLTGHIHHTSVKEGRICNVESFRTIAARDSWHHGKGYRAGRELKAIVYHKDFGEDERLTVSLREIEDELA